MVGFKHHETGLGSSGELLFYFCSPMNQLFQLTLWQEQCEFHANLQFP